MAYSDNLREVLADWDKNTPRRKHVLEEEAGMEYAKHLHDREGYYVFNPSHAQQSVRKWLKKAVAQGVPLNDKNIIRALDAAGFEDINFLRSYTVEMRDPVKKGEGPRRAHPGGWSDITGNLKASLRHRVNSQPFHGDSAYKGGGS